MKCANGNHALTGCYGSYKHPLVVKSPNVNYVAMGMLNLLFWHCCNYKRLLSRTVSKRGLPVVVKEHHKDQKRQA